MSYRDLFKAELKSDHLIEISVAKSYNGRGCEKFYLYDYDQLMGELKIVSKSESLHSFKYIVSSHPDLKIGHNYFIYDERNSRFPLNYSIMMRDDRYIFSYYSDEKMGATYFKDHTDFALFSPQASEAYVFYFKGEELFSMRMIKNHKTGVFNVTVKGDLERYYYYYVVNVNGEIVSANDPYARSFNTNSIRGMIINPEAVAVDLHLEDLPDFEKPTDAIIYEMSIRDMTSFKDTSLINKGKYLGLTEHGLTTKKGLPIGIDYIKSLGVTHVQIMPMYDFLTTNDLYPENTYNWGYDPLNYNSPEGSFATDPSDPYCRIIEMKKMIGEFHKEGIRVVMDVVYNHMFCRETSPFDILCPDYYFRYNFDGTPSNGSFCGNDLESRHPMVRKFIVDSCLYWVKEFGIDGFRFDLMGILDIDTMNLIESECRKIRKDFIIYGEGWDMPTALSNHEKAKTANAFKMPAIGFFNDRFRDTVKGGSSDHELEHRGYLLGDSNYIDGFKHTFIGSSSAISFPPLFINPSQSINYVECHDNATLFDKIIKSNKNEDIKDQLKRIKLINAMTIFSFGVPFIHSGQEIGATKNGVYNSYNSPDSINQFNYNLLDERVELYRYTKDAIAFRKQSPFMRLDENEKIMSMISFVNLPSGALLIELKNDEMILPYRSLKIFVNPSHDSVAYDLDDYYQVLFNEAGMLKQPLYAQHLVINAITCLVCAKL